MKFADFYKKLNESVFSDLDFESRIKSISKQLAVYFDGYFDFDSDLNFKKPGASGIGYMISNGKVKLRFNIENSDLEDLSKINKARPESMYLSSIDYWGFENKDISRPTKSIVFLQTVDFIPLLIPIAKLLNAGKVGKYTFADLAKYDYKISDMTEFDNDIQYIEDLNKIRSEYVFEIKTGKIENNDILDFQSKVAKIGESINDRIMSRGLIFEIYGGITKVESASLRCLTGDFDFEASELKEIFDSAIHKYFENYEMSKDFDFILDSLKNKENRVYFNIDFN